MPLTAHKNLAYSLVETAPSPAASGTSLVVTAGTGTRFPTVPFNVTIWPINSMPTPANAEIATVTNISTDTFTITRAAEGTSARTVIVGDQIAATITEADLSVLQADISAVSAAVTSVNTHANTASAAATSADAHAATASAAATSADAHAAAASAAATSVDARVNTVSNLVSSLTSAHNALSNVVSDSLSIGNVASNVLSALSDRVVSISAQLVSLEVHASAASAAATSADAHANTASAAATSVNTRVNSVNTFISGVSARSVGNVSTHGFQSVIDALSGRISAVVGGSGSVTSAEVQTASAAATSADAHASAASAAATSADAHAATASAAATSADAHAATASAAATSADAHANTASAAATSVDGRVTSVNAFISGISARSVGNVSTHGFQSVVNALSNRISAIPGAASTPAIRFLSVTATVDAVALTVVSGYSVSVSAGVAYRIEAVALCNRITTMATGYGLTFPAVVDGTQAGGRIHAYHSLVQSVGAGGHNIQMWRGDAAGSIIISLSTGGVVSGLVVVEGFLRMSTGGKVALLMRSSAAGGIQVLPGSYLELRRIS